MLILPYETLIILQRLHQWNPVNTVTNGPKKIGDLINEGLGCFAGRSKKVTIITR